MKIKMTKGDCEMDRKIMMKATGIYHPERIVNNEYFIKHFTEINSELGRRVSSLLTHIGKKKPLHF
jgi:hypothetical protein